MTPGSVNDKLGTPSIPQFYQERHILITGVTGFMGKVLLSKLLRCCPGVGKIYVLIRSSRGKNATTRLKEMLTLPVSWPFSTLSYQLILDTNDDL